MNNIYPAKIVFNIEFRGAIVVYSYSWLSIQQKPCFCQRFSYSQSKPLFMTKEEASESITRCGFLRGSTVLQRECLGAWPPKVNRVSYMAIPPYWVVQLDGLQTVIRRNCVQLRRNVALPQPVSSIRCDERHRAIMERPILTDTLSVLVLIPEPSVINYTIVTSNF